MEIYAHKAILGLVPYLLGQFRSMEGGREQSGDSGYVPQFASLDKRFPITLGEYFNGAF